MPTAPRVLRAVLTAASAALVAAAAIALPSAGAAGAGITAGGAAATPGATNVLDYGADSTGAADSTAAFLSAEDAALGSATRYPTGPTGDPQAVVYVPPGSYRLLGLQFRSNVRMEVSSGAVLEQAGGRAADLPIGPPALIVWDGAGATPLRNVTLIGIADSAAGPKSLAAPVFPGWSVGSDFTFDLDPRTTDANDLVTGLMMYNVDGFLVENVFSVQNDSEPSIAPLTDADWWPESRKAALSMNERPDTPPGGSVFYDPHDGTVQNWYNVNSPKGFGPNQVNAGHNLTFEHIYSRGGTAMRFETDASQQKYFTAEIRGVTADDIAGENCSRAVVFAPHVQMNYDVHVTDVQAVGCDDGVLESIDETHKRTPGAFLGSTIARVTVTAGPYAQNGVPGTNGLWTVGESYQAFAKDKPAHSPWSVVYTAGTFSCSGTFTAKPAAVLTTRGLLHPVCTGGSTRKH